MNREAAQWACGLIRRFSTPQHLRDYIHIEAQLTPELYLVGDCHHSPENGIVSRRIMLICELALLHLLHNARRIKSAL